MISGPTDEALSYVVNVDDMFHYQDETQRYELGRFATAREAMAACEAHIERQLTHMLKPGMTAEQLCETWMMFGEDPWCSGLDFSTFDYVRARSRELTSPRGLKSE